MLLDIRAFQQIAAVCRLRSFGRAAEALGISQPALSKSIRLLETSLGVSLFERSHRGVSATTYGEILLAASGPMLRNVDDVLAEIRRVQGLEAGAIRIGAGPFALELSVAEAAFRVARRHPGLQLRVVQGGWEALTRDVASGVLDVAVAEVAAADQEANLEVERVGAHGGSFYCRAGHPLLSRPRLVFDDIASFPLAMSPLPGRVAPFFERQGVAGRVDPTSGLFLPALTLDEVALMKRAVRETDAVSWAPDVLIADEVRQGLLRPLPFRADWARLNYGIFRRSDRPVTPALETFLVELRAVERKLSRSLGSKRVPRRRRGV
jgi:DNA-binding transcriptional LysR family regulator